MVDWVCTALIAYGSWKKKKKAVDCLLYEVNAKLFKCVNCWNAGNPHFVDINTTKNCLTPKGLVGWKAHRLNSFGAW